MTHQCSGRSRRVSFLWFESRRGAGPAVYEQAVVKLERVVFWGLIPTVYSASRLWRRHFSFYEADLTQ